MDDDRINQAINSGYWSYEYTPTLGDRIGGFFGFRTGQDKYREEMSNNYNAYVAQLLGTMREEKYNSEAAKAARMRAAGENPDLLGTSGASDASEFTDPETMPVVPESEIRRVSDSIGGVLNVVQMTTAFMKDFGSLKSILSLNEVNQSEALSKMFGVANDVGQAFFDSKGWQSFKDNASESFDAKALERLAEGFLDQYKGAYRNKKSQKRFERMVLQSIIGLPGQLKAMKSLDEFEKSRRSYNSSRASQYYSSDDDQMTAFLKPLVKASEDLQKLDLRVAYKHSENQEKFEGIIDPGLEASATNAQNQTISQSKQTEYQINKIWADVVKSLSAEADKGNQ